MKRICESCNGTGQIRYFQGVSRFLLSDEECPECGGLGFIFSAEEDVGAKGKKFNRAIGKRKKE